MVPGRPASENGGDQKGPKKTKSPKEPKSEENGKTGEQKVLRVVVFA